MRKLTIHLGQAGWAMYFDENTQNFYAFNSNERFRLAEAVLKALGIKTDDLLEHRKNQIKNANEKLGQ